MMQFNIAGKYLDLYADTSLQFSRKNILFAFDDAEVSRTASFDIPASPKNNDIFQLANDAARDGSLARTRLPAQLQYSGGVENGYLYITGAERDKYTAIFVFGELFNLKEIREAGTLYDILKHTWGTGSLSTSPSIAWTTATAITESTPLEAIDPAKVYALFRYQPTQSTLPTSWKNGTARPLPSASLKYVTEQAMSAIGYTLHYDIDVESMFERYRILQQQILNRSRQNYDRQTAWGKTIRLIDNLPDITLVDLLKAEAIAFGKALRISGNGIYFDDMDLDTWGIVYLDKLVSIGSISRTFKDYAQQNSVVFDNNDYVSTEEESRRNYPINNTNLADYKEIARIPFNGGANGDVWDGLGNYIPAAFIEDFAGGYALLDCRSAKYHNYDLNADVSYMQQVNIVEADWLTNLTDKSTTFRVDAVMTLADFNNLAEKSILNVRGQYYIWTECTWQNGVASLELSKVAL